MPINKINAEMIHTPLLSKASPSLSLPAHWLLTLFLGYWMTVQCLECSSRCRVSRIIDKPQGPDPWIRMTGLSKQPWQTLTSTSTASQVYEEKMHLGRARREVFSLNLFPLHRELQQGEERAWIFLFNSEKTLLQQVRINYSTWANIWGSYCVYLMCLLQCMTDITPVCY